MYVVRMRGRGGVGRYRRILPQRWFGVPQPPSSSSPLWRTITNTSVLGQKPQTETSPPKILGTPYAQLTVGIPRERAALEKRVAATPESVQRLIHAHFQRVLVETDAGQASHFSNESYEKAGATIVDNVWKESDIILKVSGVDWRVCFAVFCFVSGAFISG